MGDGSVFVGSGVIVTDGLVIADGVIVTDRMGIAAMLQGLSAAKNGDATACMTLQADTGVDYVDY
jgi:hypothetical protein